MGVRLIPDTFLKQVEMDRTSGKVSIMFADDRQILVDEIVLMADDGPRAGPFNDLNIESRAALDAGFAINSRLEIMPDVFIVGNLHIFTHAFVSPISLSEGILLLLGRSSLYSWWSYDRKTSRRSP